MRPLLTINLENKILSLQSFLLSIIKDAKKTPILFFEIYLKKIF